MGREQLRRRLLQWWAGCAVAVLLGLGPAIAREAGPFAGVPVVTLAELPVEARAVHRAIHSGGPFRYEKDGMVFRNRERLLPRAPRGFYREYTVDTPGARDRGARRLVCGGVQPTTPDTCFYTADHYASFRRIAP
jgi:ribonuclease T1